MKRLLVILAALLMFTGCGVQEVPETTAPPAAMSVTEPAGFYDPDSQVQSLTNGAVFAYPLPETDYTAVMPFGEKLLLLRSTGEITVVQGEKCAVTAQAQTGTDLAVNTAFSVSGSELSYYAQEKNQVVLLNSQLMELGSMAMPEDIQGTPVVSLTDKEIYYCQGQEVRALDIQTGISRLVTTHRYRTAQLEGIYLDGSVLMLKVTDADRKEMFLYLDSATGALLYETQQMYSMHSQGTGYLLSRMDGTVRQWIIGIAAGNTINLNVESQVYGALAMSGAVGCSTDNGYAVLDFYDLETGRRTAGVTIPDVSRIVSITSDSQYVWILASHSGGVTLYRWDIIKSPVVDESIYTSAVYSAQSPDLEGLALCQERADALNEQYGVRVCIWEDAAVKTEAFEVVAEHQVSVVDEMLDELEAVLTQFPQSVLRNTIRGGSLRICLVRSIGGGLTNTQFYSGGDAYILLTPQAQMQWDFPLNLAYVVDSHVLGNSRDYDNWEELNPQEFSYSYDYEWTPDETAAGYLQAENRAFIDELAMVNPQEDRCRIFLYAMQPYTGEYFASDVMQQKLRTLCEGIREAYGLEKTKDILPWERYLTLEMDFSNF